MADKSKINADGALTVASLVKHLQHRMFETQDENEYVGPADRVLIGTDPLTYDRISIMTAPDGQVYLTIN